MRVCVLLFGPQAVAAGRRSVELELSGDRPTCAAVRGALADAEPSLRDSLSASRLAVNHEFAGDEATIGAGDEVALIGMVSGG